MKKGLIVLFLFMNILIHGETIKLWHGWVGQEKAALMGVVKKYEIVSGNRVEILNVPFDALQGKFSMMVPQGEGPDLIIGPADWIGVMMEQKLLEPIDGMVAEKDRTAFIPNALRGCYYNGKLYGLPESIHIVGLYYNKELVPNPPVNTKEMIEIGLKLTDEKSSKFGLVYDKGNYYYHACWVGGFGGKIIGDDGNPTFDSKPQIDAAKFMKSLSEKPTRIMPDDIDYNTSMLLFGDGLAGMMINGNWAVGELQKKGKIKFGVIPIPTVSQTGKKSLPIAGPEVVMMSVKSRNKMVAYDFMKFVTASESQEAFAMVGHLPSRDAVYEVSKVKNSNLYEYFKAFKEQIAASCAMPTVPEMNRGIWGEGNSMLSQVLSNTNTPENIAKEAQAKAASSIGDYRRERRKD